MPLYFIFVSDLCATHCIYQQSLCQVGMGIVEATVVQSATAGKATKDRHSYS